jgi:multiple sugar transport system substrate-binding protein
MVTGIALAAMVVPLTACSSTPEAGGDTLSMWTYSSTGAAGLEAVAAQYKEDTGNTVDIEVTSPREAYTTKLQAAARSKTLPDILTLGAGSEDFQFAASGITIDLTDFVDDSWKNEFLPGMISSATLTQTAIDNSTSDSQNTLEPLEADHIYGVPYLAGSSGVIVANKTVLEAAGVATDAPPETWDDFVEAVKKTWEYSPESGGVINGLQTPEGAYQWLFRPMAAHLLGTDGLEALQSKDGYTGWSGSDGVAALKLYDQLQPYWAPGVLSLGLPEADTAFAQGQAAWDIGGTYTVPSVVDQGLDLDNLMTFPVPAPNDSVQPEASVSAIALLSAAVSSQSTKQEEAVDFIRYLTSPEGALIWAEGAQDVPATAIDSEKLTNSPLLASVIGSLSTDPASLFNPDDTSADPQTTPPIKHDVAVELARLVSGDGTPEEVAANIQAIYKSAWDAQ